MNFPSKERKGDNYHLQPVYWWITQAVLFLPKQMSPDIQWVKGDLKDRLASSRLQNTMLSTFFTQRNKKPQKIKPGDMVNTRKTVLLRRPAIMIIIMGWLWQDFGCSCVKIVQRRTTWCGRPGAFSWGPDYFSPQSHHHLQFASP